MAYTKVAVRADDGTLILQDAEARAEGGKVTVKGKLEQDETLKVDKTYKITGEVGLGEKATYIGSPGAGRFEFKIE